MIGRLTGRLIHKKPPQILLDCNGVGYEVDVPMSTFYQLPALGEIITLYTHLAIRDDAHILFGFSRPEECSTFKQLIKVNGIGARTALAILSGMSVDQLTEVIHQQAAAPLIKIPGIGKKTAERLLLELKGKLKGLLTSATTEPGPALVADDILYALTALGYSDKEALQAVKLLPPDCDVTAGIKFALQALSQ